jgi:hypothetical protein
VRPHELIHQIPSGRNLRIVSEVDVQSAHRFPRITNGVVSGSPT